MHLRNLSLQLPVDESMSITDAAPVIYRNHASIHLGHIVALAKTQKQPIFWEVLLEQCFPMQLIRHRRIGPRWHCWVLLTLLPRLKQVRLPC